MMMLLLIMFFGESRKELMTRKRGGGGASGSVSSKTNPIPVDRRGVFLTTHSHDSEERLCIPNLFKCTFGGAIVFSGAPGDVECAV